MKTVAALEIVTESPALRYDAVEALRRRLAGNTAREHVVLDFLSDDLREARDAVGAVAAYVDAVETTLGALQLGRKKQRPAPEATSPQRRRR